MAHQSKVRLPFPQDRNIRRAIDVNCSGKRM